MYKFAIEINIAKCYNITEKIFTKEKAYGKREKRWKK